jgi:hypothetical protein
VFTSVKTDLKEIGDVVVCFGAGREQGKPSLYVYIYGPNEGLLNECRNLRKELNIVIINKDIIVPVLN